MLKVKRRYKKSLIYLLPMVFFLVFIGVSKAGSDVVVSSELWSRISSPEEFMSIAGLRELITEFNQQPQSVLNIHYQGGENGLLWAQQFQNRLVALGIDSERIQLVQGVPNANTLLIGLQENK
jgi:hypothetical protein